MFDQRRTWGWFVCQDAVSRLQVIPSFRDTKTVLRNQLLAGTHIVAAAEAMALAAHRNLNTKQVYQEICASSAGSWMFTNRVPAMLEADWTPHSAIAIFVKDMGIVTSEAAGLGVPLPLANTAGQLYLQAGSEFGVKDMDSSIVRLWKSVSVSESTRK